MWGDIGNALFLILLSMGKDSLAITTLADLNSLSYFSPNYEFERRIAHE